MADNEKLVFQIGFDLDSAVKDATSEWKRVQRELEAAINARPISISMDTRGLERFNTFVERTYASLEDLQDLFPEVFKETKDGEGITKRFQAMETSINAVSKEMRNLEKVWNNLSQAEKFDDDGNLTKRAQELKRAYVELYQSQRTQGQTLQEITKEAINLANQEYEAQQRKKKQEEEFVRLLNLEETTIEKLQAKQGAWKQKLSQTEIGSSDWSNAIAEVQRLEAKMKDLQKQIKGVATETKKTSKTKVDIDTSTFAGKLKDLENRWKALNAEQRKGAEGQALRAEWRKLSEEAGRYTSTLRSAVSAEDRLANAKKKTTQATHEQNSAYKTQGGYLKRLFQRMIAYASVAQVFSFVRNIREVTAQFELQRVALGSIIGDLNEANAMFEQIKAAAVKSPFQIKELVTYTKQLAAYKIESDKLFETTQRLADISAGLGVGMERLVLAYGQIRATGYLRASEVRQLTEAGIPIVEELAKKMSQLRGETVSAAEVMGMISERAISFGMVKEVFDDMTSAGGMFYKMQEKQAETLAGQWSNLKDSISIMYEEIGNTEGVNNAMKSMIGLIKSLAENWRDVWSVVQSLSIAMGVYYVAMKNAAIASKALSIAETTRLSTLRATTVYMPKFLASTKLAITLTRAYRVATIKSATATGLLSKAFWGLTKAMLSNPYTAVLAALAGITFAIVKFATKTKTTQERIDDLNKSVASLTDLKDDVKPLVDELDALSQKANKTAQEQERLNKVTKELASMYPSTISGMRKYGEEVDITAGKVRELYETELKLREEKARRELESNEVEYAELERQYNDLMSKFRKGTYTMPVINVGSGEVSYYEKAYTEKELEELGNKALEIADKMKPLNQTIINAKIALGDIPPETTRAIEAFGSWKKTIKDFKTGLKNDLGDDIKLFDDDIINQFTSLNNALDSVAEQYNKNDEAIKRYTQTLTSKKLTQAERKDIEDKKARATAFRDTASAILDYYNARSLLNKKKGGSEDESELSILQKELQLHEKIYAKYKEYRKYMSDEQARAKVENYFGDTIKSLMFEPKYDSQGFKQVLKQYQDYARTLPESEKIVLDIGFKVEDIDWQDTKTELEDSLKRLSDQISRTKTAKEFFDRMLGMTGDKEFSASLTLSVYGEGGDLGKKLAKQTIEQLETAFEGVDISSAIDKTTGKVDYAKLAPLVEQLPEKAQANAQALVKAGEKANADWLIDLQKTYQKAFTFEERRTQVMQEEAQKRKEIEESTSLTPEQKAKYTEASRKKEAERISAINIEEFKESEDYLKIFEDIERLSIPTIERLIAKLREVIATNKELSATDLKHLTEQINKLEDGLVKKDAWAGLLSGIRDLQKARETISQTAKGTKEYADAMDDANKANVKIQNALGGLQSEFSQAQQLIESFADTLGIAEDSDFGVFLNGMAEAVGGVSKALAFAQLAVQLFDGTIKSFLASNPIGWILLAVSAIISAVQAIMNARINRINKEIEALEDKLDNLEYAYDRLQKSAERAFGTEYIQNYNRQLANLEAQVEAYEKQLDLERSKGKKADEEKIKEYQEQIRDTKDAIEDMYGSLSEHFLGTDLTSAARDFANAWIDAYKSFSNTTDAMKEKFQEMIQNMIVESLIAKVMERALKPVFDMVDDMGDSDFYSNSFWSQLMTEMNKATENGVVGAQNIMGMLESIGINLRDTGTGLTGISRDIATASEESILGLAAGINTQNFYISQVPTKLDTIIGLLRGGSAVVDSGVNVQDLITIQNQFLSHLPTIAQNTAETVARCERAAVACESMASKLGSVIKPKGTTSTHSVNVTIGS